MKWTWRIMFLGQIKLVLRRLVVVAYYDSLGHKSLSLIWHACLIHTDHCYLSRSRNACSSEEPICHTSQGLWKGLQNQCEEAWHWVWVLQMKRCCSRGEAWECRLIFLGLLHANIGFSVLWLFFLWTYKGVVWYRYIYIYIKISWRS